MSGAHLQSHPITKINENPGAVMSIHLGFTFVEFIDIDKHYTPARGLNCIPYKFLKRVLSHVHKLVSIICDNGRAMGNTNHI